MTWKLDDQSTPWLGTASTKFDLMLNAPTVDQEVQEQVFEQRGLIFASTMPRQSAYNEQKANNDQLGDEDMDQRRASTGSGSSDAEGEEHTCGIQCALQ